jgi:hypothetical protein
LGMKRATITITDELERAIEQYRQDLEVPPALAAIVQTALRKYLTERGYLLEGAETGEEEEFIPSTGGKPRGLTNAPRPRGGGNPVSDAVIEDRR